MRFIALILLIFILSGCLKNQLGQITGSFSNGDAPVVTSVTIVNDQLIVTGTNLADVDTAKVEGTLNHSFQIESKSETQVILNATSAIGFLIGGAFDLVIGNAHGAATFPISFDLADGQVTSPKLHNMGAGTGEVLTFNGTNWVPGSPSGSQIYAGTYNATTDTPDIVTAGGPAGTFYIVTVAGTQDLGTGNITFAVGDWVIFDGTDWSKVPLSSASVSSFNGRLGAVVPLADDYTWDMLDKTGAKIAGSALAEIEDVDVTGIADNDVLIWDSGTSTWVAGAVPLSGTASGNIQMGANYINNDGGSEGISFDTAGRATISTTNGAVSGALGLSNASTAVGSGNAMIFKNGSSNQTVLAQEVISAGYSDFFMQSLTGNTLTEKFRILANGNFGIGTPGPTEKLEVSGGNIAATSGQVYSTRQSSSAASPLTIDANSGNVMVWSTNTPSPTANLHNLKAGGSYMLVVAGTGTGTVTINCFSDAGVTPLPSSFVPANGSRVDGTLDKTVYTIISDGTNCLITWITGF